MHFEDLVMLVSTHQTHPVDSGHLIATSWPQQYDNYMARMVLQRTLQVTKDLLHCRSAKWVEKIENQRSLGKYEFCRIFIDGPKLTRASVFGAADVADVDTSRLM